MQICILIANLHTFYVERTLTSYLKRMVKKFPILSVTGPRQSGKTTLLKKSFPDFKYFNVERPDVRQLINSDPLGFLKEQGADLILDEIQNLPELFSYIQAVSDDRGTAGQYILSGSQSFLLDERISQSLVGRVNVNLLLPFDLREISGMTTSKYSTLMHSGFYPGMWQGNILAGDFFPSYIQTYVDRDLRTLRAVSDLESFTRFIGLCAGRTGQVLNISSLANDAGVSVNTAKSWISVLESSYILFLLRPYFNNFNKRLIKSPKLYFWDTGLLCQLLRINNPLSLKSHYLYGSIFENMIIADLIKQFCHSGKPPAVYYWRESNGNEIDCLIELSSQNLLVIEIKGGETFTKDYLKGFRRFKIADEKILLRKLLVHPGALDTVIDDIQVADWNEISGIVKGCIDSEYGMDNSV